MGVEELLRNAIAQVAEARRIVARQEQQIAHLREIGSLTGEAEKLLDNFTKTLTALEDYERDLRRLAERKVS